MSKAISLVSAAVALSISVPAFAGGIQPLVDAAWLSSNLDKENLVVLDVRNRIDGGSAETFAEGHIPGAVYSNYASGGWRVKRDGIVGMLPPSKIWKR